MREFLCEALAPVPEQYVENRDDVLRSSSIKHESCRTTNCSFSTRRYFAGRWEEAIGFHSRK